MARKAKLPKPPKPKKLKAQKAEKSKSRKSTAKAKAKAKPKVRTSKPTKPKQVKPKQAKQAKQAKSRFLKIPERDEALETGFVGDVLFESLVEIAEEGGPKKRQKILTQLKSERMRAMDFTYKRFKRGHLNGLETARVISAIHDDLITALWRYAQSYEVKADNPTESERIALCAVGGYGRGEMAPESDLDLLFLIADKKGSAHTEALTEYMLYMLWDLGLKIGHSTRTVEQSIAAAKDDQTILTTLLDLRYLGGDKELARQLYTQFSKKVTRGAGRGYIGQKLAERDARHTREGNSRYVIEPNIKEGKGGLRDLHVLYWMTRFLDSSGQITDPQRARNYVEMGLFDARAAKRFRHAADFLWRTRHHLHWSAGRATEVLSFDQQVKLARLMGHASGPVEVAVERFMREYFTNAREVGALTRIACAKLEAKKTIRLVAGLEALVPRYRRNLRNKNLTLKHGRLNLAKPEQLLKDPTIIMQLFETAGRRNLDIHPDAFSEIDFRRYLIDINFCRDPENSRLFQKTLLEAKAPYATLKTMNESGVLGRYLLEFGGIVGRTQFNMHHAYTVDEHTLRLVDNVDDLAKGRLKKEVPLASKIAASFSEEQRLILFLACLLHDTGKGQGDQCIEGAQLARRACRRLGVTSEITDTVAWLVRRHLDMSETAQRRDISNPDTIASFAGLVGSLERLNLLYVLTVADIRSVGPGVWNDWKATLLRSLYEACADYLDGREELEPVARAASLKEQLLERLPEKMGEAVAPIVSQLPEGYWLNFDMADLVRHARFFDGLLEKKFDFTADSATHIRVDKTRNVTELWVLSRDRVGLFADLTLAIGAAGANVSGARLHTGEGGLVMNVFYLHGSDGQAFGVDAAHRFEKFKAQAYKAAQGETEGLSVPRKTYSRRSNAIPARPRTRFIPTQSGGRTIIEIQGRDRPGLLYDLAGLFRDAGLSVNSAHIEAVGIMAVDAFYIGDLIEPARQKKLRADLLSVLRDPSKPSSGKPSSGKSSKSANTQTESV